MDNNMAYEAKTLDSFQKYDTFVHSAPLLTKATTKFQVDPE